MAENPLNSPELPLLDRMALEEQYGGYTPAGAPEPLPNIPFRGLSTPTPGGGEQPISALQALDASVRPSGRGELRGGSIPRSMAELTNPRYNVFVPGDYNNEDAYAQGQSWTEKMVNGVGKGLALTGTTFLQGTVGLVNGVGNWIATGNFSSFYDNELNRSLDDINKRLDNNLLPNYYTDVEKNAKWYSPDNLFTANFLWNGVVKNLGFAAGAALSGGVYAAGIKALSALPGISRLISVGKQAEVLAATEAGLTSVNKVADTFGKVKSLSDRFLSSYNVLNKGGRAVVAGLSTTGEAGFEALQTLNDKRNQLIEDYIIENDGIYPTGEALDDINRKSEEYGNSAFLLNVGLLSATNYIQFPRILGATYRGEKSVLNSLTRETKDIVEDAGKYVAKPTRGGKVLGTLNKIRPYTFSVSEAFEEGAQFAIGKGVNDYYNKKNNNEPTSFLESLSEGFVQTFGTDEGMENILIGGLSGAIMQGRGRFAEERAKSRNTIDAIQKFNQYRLSDFTKDTIDSVNRGTVLQQEREEFLKRGDVLNSKDREADFVTNYLTPRIKYGRFDLVEADIRDYKALASTEEGFAQLVAEGKALPTDTREAFLDRVSKFEQTAKNTLSLYQSLNLRYGGLVDDQGKPLYTSAVMDKMVYAASKVADYDVRIPALTPKLAAAGINVDQVIRDIIDGKVDSFNDAIDNIKSMKDLTDDQKEDLGMAMEDVAEMSIRRDSYLKEYNEIKKSPAKFQEFTPTDIEEPETSAKGETIKVKTKTGEKEIEVGTEYFVGKGVDYDAQGLEVPVEVSMLTVLGENEDGTIKIKDNKGDVRDVSKQVLEDYKLSKVADLRANKTANYFYNHRNEIFEYNFGEKFGGRKPGRLEYQNGKLFFVYKDNKGKIRRKQVDNSHFVAQEGYTQSRISRIGKVENAEQRAAREEFTSAEEIAKQKESLAKKRDLRLQIITELEKETSERLESVTKKLETKKKELQAIQKDLDKIGDEVRVAEPRSKREKALEAKYPELSRQKVRFTRVFSTTTRALSKLSRMREDVQDEIAKLTAEKDELEFNLAYIQDFGQNLDELPENSGDFLKELKEQVQWVDMLVKETGKNINALADMGNSIEKLIKDFISLLEKSLKKIDTDYPAYIKDSIEKFKQNPSYSEGPMFREALEDYLFTQDVEKEISVNEKELNDINDEVSLLYKKLEELGNEYNAKKKILDRFQEIIDAYEIRKNEEQRIMNNKQLIEAAVGSAYQGVQVVPFETEYEANPKKADEIIPRATMGVMRGKPHQVRANTFGFNLNRFANRKNIRGVYVTSKNEDQILPGLTDRLRMDEAGQINEDVKKDEIIALVMVQENPDGTIVLVGEDGQPIPEGVAQLDAAIYQVFPDGDLKWGAEFNNQSMFRKDTPEEVRDAVTKQYKEWRKSVLENPSLQDRHEVDASFGRIQEVKDADGNTIYDTRTSAQAANLITADDLEINQLINVPTTNTTVSQGTVSFTTPLGRVFLELPNGLVKLQNRQHTRKEAETIFQAILQQARYMMDPKVGLDDPRSERLFNWLRSVTYWGIPRDQQENRKEAGYNSIFWEVDEETGMFMLSLSGKGKDFVFTPTSLEENRESIITIISELYNNVNNSMTKQLNEPYEEILSISESGEVTSRVWKNYQSYLLSNTTPDGKTRSGEEIPLTTLMRPVASPEDVNRTDIYFYTTDTADDYVIPVVEKKKALVPKTLIPGAPKAAPKAKGEEDVFRPGDEEAETGYVLDGKTVNTYVSPKSGNRIKFKATAAASPTNLDAITVVTGGEDNDIQEIIETIKKAGKDPKTEILNQIYKAIAPQIEQELQEEEDAFTPNEEVLEAAEKQTGAKPSKSVLDALKQKVKGLNDKAMRLVIEKELKAFKPENWDQVETWLKANFPNIPVFRVKNLIQATNGRQAWGMFKDGAIYIYENAEVGTVYHEVFHAVWRMVSDPAEQKAVLDEMRARSGKFFDRASLKDISYREATDEQLEEKLAEEFRDYVQDRKIPAKPREGRPFVLKLFADLVTMIKEFFLGPQSASKVENMFSKINQGSYKSHIPFQTNLAFAKEGIIDIEDAFATSDAALSLTGITDRERADIINHMTYLTLIDLIKTDRSIFNIEKRNKKEVYATLKEQVLQTIAKKIQSAQALVDEGVITQEEANPLMVSTVQLMQDVDAQWDLITERHEEFLKAYSIEFDENDNINLRDENNSGRETYQDATKIDNFKKANSAVKLLLATIPVVDNEGNIEPSSIGGAQLLPSSKTYISLMNNLHTSASVEEMLERLRNMAVNDPNYRTLYQRLTKKPWFEGGVDLSKIETQHGLQLLSAFWGTFKKQAPDVRNVFILENGEVVVGEANLSSAAQQLRSEYINAIVLKARSGEGYFTYDQRKKIFKGDPKKVAGVELDKFPKMVSFLNKMGVPFTISDVNKMNNTQKKAFREAVSGIRESISKTEEIATFSGKVLDINKRLLTLGLLKSAVDNPEFSSTFFNVSGERTQTYIGTNAVSDLSEFIGKLERFGKDTVGGTKYNYLLTDSFAKRSNLMSRIFSSGGIRKKDTEDLLKVGYVSGMVNEENGKRRESSKLTYRDRLVQELNLNLAGWYLNLVPGDASIEHMIKMGNAVSLASINRGMLEVNEIFKEYFLSELELVREDRPVAKGRNAKEMRFFLGILGKELHDSILKDGGSPIEVYNRFESRINTKLENFIEKDTAKLEKVLRDYGILTTMDQNSSQEEAILGYTFKNVGIPKGLSEKQKDNHLTMLSVNYMIANIEMHKLLYSDPYQYEDELKRIKSFNSPRQAIINNSPKMNAALDRVWNRGYKSDDIGFTKFGQDYFRSATHKDVIGIIDLPGYEDFKETDGSGIINMKANRQFRIRAGNWNDNEELQYKYDIAWEKNDKGMPLTKEEQAIYNAGNPQVKSAYTPLKPIVSGSKLDKNGLPSAYNNIVLDKFALYPLSYRIMKEINSESNAVKLYNKMQREDIDYVVFESGRKVGSEKPHDTYIDGEFNDKPYEVVINVPFSIMSIQSEVPSKEDNLVTRGSQITKLVTLDFLEAGVPVDFMEDTKDFTKRYDAWYKLTDDQKLAESGLYREIKNNQDLLEALTEWGYKNTLNKLGIKETTYKDPNGLTKKKFEIVDRSKAVQTLRDEILKREVNDNISDALAGFLQGKVVLEATPAYQQVRNIIYSIADKSFISPKINGGMKVQIPSTFLEGGVRNVKDGLYESDVLKFYEKDGKNVAEVMVGRWFDSPLSDDELLDYFNNTPEGQKELAALAGVGFRIPTQKQNSIDAIVIKKFLPKEFGDSVIIPAALVQKVGSDFDIDKLSLYLKNVYVKDGKPKLIPYFGKGEAAIKKLTELYDKGEFLNDKERQELERYIAEEQLLLQDVAEGSLEGKLIEAIFSKLFSEQEITESFTRGIPAREQIINQLYKKSLENEYIQSMENLITHPKNYDNLIKPNSVEDIKKLANEIAEKTIGESFDYRNVDNMLDRTFMSRLRHAFVTGKYAIGIAAVNQTNHSLNQRQPIYIDKSRLDLLSPEDREWIGNADIKFQQYNTINIGGKMVATLSMIKNKAGEHITDILGKLIDGYVDISKGPWIMELGATPNVASTWMFLIKAGVPLKTVVYFMNQPIIRDYLRTIESAGYSWLFIDSFVDLTSQMYEDAPMHPKEFNERLARFTIPSEAKLKDNVGKNIRDFNKNDKLEQQFILREFLKYAKMAEQLFLVTQGANYDTSTFNDPMLVFKKQMQQIKAQQTIINSVDTILSNSFIGNLANTINETRDAFAEVLMSDQKNIRGVVQKVLMPYITLNDRDFVKIARKVVNDLFDWAVQTDQNLNKMIKDILVDDGGVSKEAKMFANMVESDPNHALHDRHNEVLEILNAIPSRRAEGGANNIKLEMGDTRVYDQNNVIYAFRELRDYLKGEDNPLYERIKTLAVLQSGLSSSPVSFTSLLPHEDFEDIYNKTLVKINSMSNLDDFYNLGVFQRNNWNDDDVVPYMRAKTIKTASGRSHYNPSMKFLSDPVKEAVMSGQIPPVMTLSRYNREANSDYIVYTWEKELELLTPEEIKNNKPFAQQKLIKERKAEMRRIGDFSYINKSLFKKVYDDYGKALETTDYKGKPYFVYKAINAWGDSFRANEFWPTDHKSVLENGFIKVEDVNNNVIITKFLDGSKVKTKPTTSGMIVADVKAEYPGKPEFNKLPGRSATPTMTYAGIGSRQTPQEVLAQMTEVAKELEAKGYTLRSGAAEGADAAFESGVKSKKEIFKGFDPTGEREIEIAHEIHPNLKGAMEAAKRRAEAKGKNGERSAWAVQNLMARNTNQVFGENLDTPVDFVLFYAEEVPKSIRPKGGTGQAVEMARRKGIPTINMANPTWRTQLNSVLSKEEKDPFTC
jgi:hypothetical protein